jgi:hypothetical protein
MQLNLIANAKNYHKQRSQKKQKSLAIDSRTGEIFTGFYPTQLAQRDFFAMRMRRAEYLPNNSPLVVIESKETSMAYRVNIFSLFKTLPAAASVNVSAVDDIKKLKDETNASQSGTQHGTNTTL